MNRYIENDQPMDDFATAYAKGFSHAMDGLARLPSEYYDHLQEIEYEWGYQHGERLNDTIGKVTVCMR
jgi:hypothetical protein